MYDTVLAYELGRRGLRVARQQAMPVVYENVRIDAGFRADLIVEDKVIVEVKSVELLAPVHKKQLLTYLRLADKRLGLLINFQVALIKDGITRIVNGLEEDSHANRILFQPRSGASGISSPGNWATSENSFTQMFSRPNWNWRNTSRRFAWCRKLKGRKAIGIALVYIMSLRGNGI